MTKFVDEFEDLTKLEDEDEALDKVNPLKDRHEKTLWAPTDNTL